MFEINGKYTKALVLAETIEEECVSQIQNICNCEVFEDCKIVIMEDTHAGKGSVIGFTCTMPKNGRIIPNIVGVDISCFTGDTKVRLTDGRDLTFVELIKEYNEGKQNYCFCLDKDYNIQISKIDFPREIDTTNELVEIILDNNEKIRCTLDHKFYTINGDIKEARNLREGEALYPLYLDIAKNVKGNILRKFKKYNNDDEHLVVFQPNKKEYDYVHILADDYNVRQKPDMINKMYDGRKSFVRHHIDFNKYNNNPDNIQRVGYKEHWKLHNSSIATSIAMKKNIEKNPDLCSRAGKKGSYALWHGEKAEQYKENAKKRLLEYRKSEKGKEQDKRASERQKKNNTTKFKILNKDEKMILLQKKSKLIKIINKCIELYGVINEENYNKARKGIYNAYSYEKGISILKKLGYNDFKEIATYKNHKIISIKYLKVKNEKVYCLTNKEYGNFALSSGVFVKNCGMLCIKLKEKEIDYQLLDDTIRKYVPSGAGGQRNEISKLVNKDIEEKVKDICKVINLDAVEQLKKCGSLGGGNHFISIEEGQTGKYLIIHSGSRNIGLQVASYFQKKAICKEGMFKELSYIEGVEAEQYLLFSKYCDEYAKLSRRIMAEEIINRVGLCKDDEFTTVHNYINQEDMIIRKGAISCKKDEKVLIPINMAYGSFICVGKGCEEYNNSAPHGAGRILSRSKAKDVVSMEEYKEKMKGIWTTSVNEHTKDESPMVYKDGKEIKRLIENRVDIIDHLKPLYNFKSSK